MSDFLNNILSFFANKEVEQKFKNSFIITIVGLTLIIDVHFGLSKNIILNNKISQIEALTRVAQKPILNDSEIQNLKLEVLYNKNLLELALDNIKNSWSKAKLPFDVLYISASWPFLLLAMFLLVFPIILIPRFISRKSKLNMLDVLNYISMIIILIILSLASASILSSLPIVLDGYGNLFINFFFHLSWIMAIYFLVKRKTSN